MPQRSNDDQVKMAALGMNVPTGQWASCSHHRLCRPKPKTGWKPFAASVLPARSKLKKTHTVRDSNASGLHAGLGFTWINEGSNDDQSNMSALGMNVPAGQWASCSHHRLCRPKPRLGWKPFAACDLPARNKTDKNAYCANFHCVWPVHGPSMHMDQGKIGAPGTTKSHGLGLVGPQRTGLACV